MKVTFILPEALKKPVGGYKMVYEYANMLSDEGHDVTILHTYTNALARHKTLPLFVKKIVYIWRYPRHIEWFEFNKNVKIFRRWFISNKEVPDGDIVVATAYETANPVSKLNDTKGKKVYFIQGYETWDADEKALAETYALGMKNIVISSWLKRIVDRYSVYPVALVPNGIDLNTFYKEKDFSERSTHSIAFMWSVSENKGSKYGLEAIQRLKKMYPDLQVKIFGIEPFPEQLGPWASYYYCASELQLRKIFNESKVYLCSSLAEGFGLTGIESMACGCALVSTDTNGVREYAIDGYNAILCPIRDSDALVKNVQKVFEDNVLAINIATNGEKTVRERFDIKNAYNQFKKSLSE